MPQPLGAFFLWLKQNSLQAGINVIYFTHRHEHIIHKIDNLEREHYHARHFNR